MPSNEGKSAAIQAKMSYLKGLSKEIEAARKQRTSEK
jgi:hypothetical protein